MRDNLQNYYKTLGVDILASPEEIKTAYRDLAKVWHPDRFAHDPRLQEKAQDKLREINEAYQILTSTLNQHKTRYYRSAEEAATAQTNKSHEPDNQYHQSSYRTESISVIPIQSHRNKSYLLLFLIPLLILISSLLLLRQLSLRDSSSIPVQVYTDNINRSSEENKQIEAKPNEIDTGKSTTVKKSSRPVEKEKIQKEKIQKEEQIPSSNSNRASNQISLPTIRVTIDPTTGLLATSACRNRMVMTYVKGQEPESYCRAQHEPK
jgi:curved DNA-binding protein CbpA